MDARKRVRPEAAPNNSNGRFKRSKQEMESNSTGLGSKSKPCTKIFSTSGCPFGDNCHFLHYVPGGCNAMAQMTNLGAPVAQVSRNIQGPGGVGRFSGRGDQVPGPVSSFGASATAKISVDASLAGAITGKGGIHFKQICRETGVKLKIQDHERDSNLKVIELEGTFEQINEASGMVRELIGRLGSPAMTKRLQGIGGSEDKINEAEWQKRQVREHNAAMKEATGGLTGTGLGSATHSTTGQVGHGTGTHQMSALPGHGTGHLTDRVVEGTAGVTQPIGRNTGTGRTTAHNPHVGGGGTTGYGTGGGYTG